MKAINKSILFTIIVYLVLCSCKPSINTETKKKNTDSSDDKIKIEYIAHASFLLSYKEHTLLLDPYADTVWISYFFPKDIDADAIFSTHPHYDHDGGIFRNLHPYWQDQIPFYTNPGIYNEGAFKIQGIKGKHCDPYGKEFGQKNTIFIFEAAGIRIAHWGDNGPIHDTLMQDLVDIDILMLPIDDTYHILKADETAEVIRRINPKVVIPMHYKISALEPTPGKPKNLGTIDKYINANSNVTILENNVLEIDLQSLPEHLNYIVFPHSPKVKGISLQ
jgi:L-ascorbate metabolism protein UlaG (beta-lactamase superfamily)